jgi:hypothetical protein
MKWAFLVPAAFAVILTVLGLVAIIRCPASSVPEVVRALGTWWHLNVKF